MPRNYSELEIVIDSDGDGTYAVEARHRVPEGDAITPRVPLALSPDAPALRDWLVALGFTVDLMIPGEREGAIHHCQLDWPEGGRVLLSSTGERPTPCRPGTGSLHVVTADPDAVKELDRQLNLNESVLRTKLVRPDIR